MKIEYDRYYENYVVWKIINSGSFEIYKGSKKNCNEFLMKNRGKSKWKNF